MFCNNFLIKNSNKLLIFIVILRLRILQRDSFKLTLVWIWKVIRWNQLIYWMIPKSRTMRPVDMKKMVLEITVI